MAMRRGGTGARAAAFGVALALLGGCGDGGGDGEGGDAAVPTEDDPAGELAGGVRDPGTGDDDPGTVPEGTVPDTDASPGGGGGEALAIEAPAGAEASPWLAFVDLFSNASRTDFGSARVSLSRLEEPVAFADHVDFYANDYIVELDTCLVRDLDADDGLDGGGGGNPDHVSGGETLSIVTADGSSFGELARVDEPGDVTYDADGSLPGTPPAGAALSIPGDVFPAVVAYPLLSPAPPVRLSPVEGEGLTTTSEYRWVPAEGPGLVKLDFLADSREDGSFRGFPVTCFARDDGEFALTDEALEALAGSPDTISLRYSRVAFRLDWRDGIVFFLESEVSE